MRLDVALATRGLADSRSQAESYIKLGLVKVDGRVVNKAGLHVGEEAKLQINSEQYVSRAALKLASVAEQFGISFVDSVVLDVGSSTGGFTDYVLQHGAKRVIAVDVGTNQLHAKLRNDARVELHEKTDIRDVRLQRDKSHETKAKGDTNMADKVFMSRSPDVVVADVSFISLKQVLLHISNLMNHNSVLIAMCKPQFEAGREHVNKGVVKNSAMRRKILKDFEQWLTTHGFIIKDKADSHITGSKGNIERFYLLKKT